jgi:capsular polysaccharide biosynthesis protein
MTESPEQETAAPGRISRFRAKFTALPAWWPLPVCVLAGMACGVSYGLLKTPEYAATSYVVAAPAKETKATHGAEPGAALGLAQAYGRIATSDSTIAHARVAAAVPAQTLRTRVRTETSPDSPVIAITGTSTRPGQAADFANAVAEALLVSGNQVAENTGVQLLNFARAIPPSRPLSPSLPISAAVGGSTGGLVGGLVLLVRPGPPRRAPATAVPAPAQEPQRELV